MYHIIEAKAKQLFVMNFNYALIYYRFLFQFEHHKENATIMMIKILADKNTMETMFNIIAHFFIYI